MFFQLVFCPSQRPFEWIHWILSIFPSYDLSYVLSCGFSYGLSYVLSYGLPVQSLVQSPVRSHPLLVTGFMRPDFVRFQWIPQTAGDFTMLNFNYFQLAILMASLKWIINGVCFNDASGWYLKGGECYPQLLKLFIASDSIHCFRCYP